MVAGVESAVQLHIDRGDDLNAYDEKGQTPLMLSAARNKAIICKLLLDAGADPSLRDPSGRDALSIALAAGATEAASVIKACCPPLPIKGAIDTLGDLAQADERTATVGLAGHEATTPIGAQTPGMAASEITSVAIADGEAFDFGSWESEEDQTPPEDDPTLAVAAVALQRVFSEHQPIDTSVDWDDFEAYLPERATSLPRADDAGARERLRLLLLRAIREGSVPHLAIEDLTLGDDGEPDLEAGAVLSMVVNDLGAEIDERFEYSASHDNFEVFVSPEEAPEEEEAIADALAFVDDFATRRNDPLRLYQRELQRQALLTAEAEVALGQAMERGIENALDALAAWPTGISATLEAARMVVKGSRPLRSMSSGPQGELKEVRADAEASAEMDAAEVNVVLEPTAADGEPANVDDEADPQLGLDARASTDELAEFSATAELLTDLQIGGTQGAPDWESCRGALISMGLTRGFLMELADAGLSNDPDSAAAFSQAIGDYRRARDRMTVANLKLVHFIAKKYLFSGQPLDDLLQEGNIGLIKAVDRYDWRRGFKFSTYATWWIRQQVGRFVADKGKAIRIPVHVYEKTQRIAQVARAFELRHGHAPTLEEVAAQVELPVLKVEALSRLGVEPLSLHDLPAIDDLIAVHVKDQFATRDPMECVECIQLGASVDWLLSTLRLKEENVLRMRFGLGIGESMTLEEVGARLDVTRERIRQIEAVALRRLKHPTRRDRFLAEIGLTPEAPRRAQAQGDANAAGEDKRDEPTEQADTSADEHKPPAQPLARPEQGPNSESKALDELLEHIRTIGFTVEDASSGPDRTIWVHITETPDNHTRKIVGKLIELGFEFWPGRGYWR